MKVIDIRSGNTKFNNLVEAVNSVFDYAADDANRITVLEQRIGTLTDLETIAKNSIVEALNEVNSKAAPNAEKIQANTAAITKLETEINGKIDTVAGDVDELNER